MRADGGFIGIIGGKDKIAVMSSVGGGRVSDIDIGDNNGTKYGVLNSVWGITIWASDTRLKENLLPTTVTSALDKVEALDFIQFDWKNTEYNESVSEENRHKDIGLSANQVQEIIPSAVFEVGEDKIKNINNSEMTIYALKAIQELSTIVKEQANRIEQLENYLK